MDNQQVSTDYRQGQRRFPPHDQQVRGQSEYRANCLQTIQQQPENGTNGALQISATKRTWPKAWQ